MMLPLGIINASEDIFEISKIQFVGSNSFQDEELLDIIYSEEDEEFDTRLVKLDKIVLMNFYRKSGFLTVEINDSLIQNNILNQVEINYVIHEGLRYYLGRFEFSGNKIINTDFLHEIFEAYKAGEPFDEGRINQGKQIIEGHYYDESGNLISFDPSVKNTGEGTLLVNRDFFLSFLDISANYSLYLDSLYLIFMSKNP